MMKTTKFLLLGTRYCKTGVSFRVPWPKPLTINNVNKHFTLNFHKHSGLSVVSPIERKPDILLEQLQQAPSVDKVVSLIQDNLAAVTATHCTHALQHINSDLSNEVISREDLIVLCNALIRKARFLTLNEVVTAIRELYLLRVSTKTVVMQTVLHHLRSKINSLSFKQVFFLEGLFKKMDQTPLVTSFLTALPLVIQNHLDMQMNQEDIREMTQLFRFAAYHKFGHNDLQKISTAILACTSEWSIVDARAILWGLTSLRREDAKLYQRLVMKATTEFSRNINNISSQEFLKLLKYLRNQNALKRVLLKLAIQRAVTEKWDFDCFHTLAKLAVEDGFFDLALFNTYEEMGIFDINQSKLTISAFEFIDILANMNVSSPNLKLLWEETRKQLQSEQHPKVAADLILNLITLGYDCSVAHDTVFHKYDLVNYLIQQDKDAKAVKKSMILLHLMGKSNQLQNEQKKERLNELAKMQLLQSENLGFPLKRALNLGLKDFHIYDSMLTTSGIYIDHLVVKKDEITLEISQLDHLVGGKVALLPEKLSTEGTRIAILLRTLEDYAVNSLRMRGDPALSSRLLRHEGFTVIEICYEEWIELLEKEHASYLARAVSECYKLE